MARWRYFTQHALTGEVLHPALPLSDVDFGGEMNGPGAFSGTLSPRFVQANVAALLPGRALVFAEADGFLRWGGLVWDITAEDGEYRMEAASWSSYLTARYDSHGQLGGRGPYTYADPCKVIRDVWAYAQEQPDGNLGVVVDSTSSTMKVGTPAEPWNSFWYETPNLGDHLDDLVSEEGAPQYTNTCRYLTNGTVEKRLKLGYPRLGTRRTDISFKTGVNIIDAPPVQYAGDQFANVILATGSGEGTATRRAEAPARDGGLRMEHHLALPSVNGIDVLGKRAASELKRRRVLGQVESITVRDHPNAPLGSWQIGDDVHVTVANQWVVWSGWARIIADSYRPSESPDQAVLTLKRADSYHYGSPEAA
ncbi:hypothetical protein G6W51_16850 [Streptomyces coelicolor]|nr:hypothetical protein [Streptomyces coelicolor]